MVNERTTIFSFGLLSSWFPFSVSKSVLLISSLHCLKLEVIWSSVTTNTTMMAKMLHLRFSLILGQWFSFCHRFCHNSVLHINRTLLRFSLTLADKNFISFLVSALELPPLVYSKPARAALGTIQGVQMNPLSWTPWAGPKRKFIYKFFYFFLFEAPKINFEPLRPNFFFF